MGSYRYCDHCNAPLGKPTIEEDLLHNGADCLHCGKQQPTALTEVEWLIELSDELKELKELYCRVIM